MRQFCLIFVLGSLFFACDHTYKQRPMKLSSMTETDTIRPTTLIELSNKKIYFGHMSVGNNILGGVQEILEKTPDVQINISRGDNPELLENNNIVHSAVGRNGDPFSKIDSFAEKMRGGLGGCADIAMFKFCYVDIHAQTDIDAVLSRYTSTMDSLSREFPETLFVHITAPVTTLQKGPKALIKKMLGMDIGLEDNLARKKYNNKLVSMYAGRQPVFDLAGTESTYADGSREQKTLRGEKVYLMIPSYTYDSGHLSEQGSRRVASDFLQFLASL